MQNRYLLRSFFRSRIPSAGILPLDVNRDLLRGWVVEGVVCKHHVDGNFHSSGRRLPVHVNPAGETLTRANLVGARGGSGWLDTGKNTLPMPSERLGVALQCGRVVLGWRVARGYSIHRRARGVP